MPKNENLNIRDIIVDMSPLMIGGHPVTLELCNQGIETDPSTWGIYSPTTSQIILDNRQTDSCMASTLLHEVLHAAIENQGVVMPPGLEESMVRVITAGLFAVLMANPRLLGILAIVSAQNENAKKPKGGRRGSGNSRSKADNPRR